MRTETGAELPTLVKAITQAKIAAYAVTSGDGNPLHTDPLFATGTQFGGTIAHGMLILAYVSEMLTEAFGQRWLDGGRLKVRFRAPARPGDTITVSGQVRQVKDGSAVCLVDVHSQTEETLLSGEAEVAL
jgi:3-hydroxybutyryl-CoA dehydratase